MGAFTGEQLLVLIVIAAVIIFFVRRSNGKSSEALRSVPTTEAGTNEPAQKHQSGGRHDKATSHLTKDGSEPDSFLRCIIQTADGDQADFLDGYVGSYRETKLLRIVMQNDERSEDGTYDWHSWDVPWSQLVDIILRRRITPIVGTNTRQPDGTYGLKGPYLQTRLYKIGRGIECRLLDHDERDMEAGEPFSWLKANILDSGVRFSRDTQEDPLYGDGQDRLDEYVLHLKSREQLRTDEEATQGVLRLSKEKIEALTAASSKQVRDYLESQQFSDDVERRFSHLKDAEGNALAGWCINYARNVVRLTLVRAIPYNYYQIFFYRNFPDTGAASGIINGKVKADLVVGLRYMLMHFTELAR